MAMKANELTPLGQMHSCSQVYAWGLLEMVIKWLRGKNASVQITMNQIVGMATPN